MTPSVYMENGYNSRGEYLRALADDYGVDYQTVIRLAQALGPNKDFDGLVEAVKNVAANNGK